MWLLISLIGWHYSYLICLHSWLVGLQASAGYAYISCSSLLNVDDDQPEICGCGTAQAKAPKAKSMGEAVVWVKV